MENKKNIFIILIAIILIIGMVFIGIKTLEKKKTEELVADLEEFFVDAEKTTVVASITDIQKKVDEEINAAIKDTTYTLDNALVMINPYKISPLTALIIFQTSSKVSLSIQINNDEKIDFESSKEHAIPIYGLLPDTNNTVSITTSDNQSKTYIIKTSALPTNILPMNVSQADKTKLNNDLYLLTSPMGEGSVAYDKDGKVRWYLTENFFVAPLILENGHLILSNGQQRDQLYSNTGFLEVDLLGKIYNEYLLDEGYHHDVIVKDNNFIVAASNPNHERYLDYIVEINSTGQIVKTWDLYEIINKIDSELTKTFSDAWAWNNSVSYDKKTNSLILSLRGRNSIVSIDYNTSKINWIFGDKLYWSDKFVEYLLEPNINTRLPLGQHSAFITTEGYLGFYNNGYESSDYTNSSSCSSVVNNYSSIGLYKIENNTITQIMDYDANKTLFSYALSNFKILSNNNRLILNGWEFTPESYTRSNCTTLSNMDIFAHIIELDSNNNVLFDATINQGKYRVEKLSLYTENSKKINTTTYAIHGAIKSNTLNEVNLSNLVDNLRNAEEIGFDYEIDTSKLIVSAFYPSEDEIKLLFVSENGKGYEFTVKEKNSSYIKTIYTHILKGKYRVFLIWNDEYKDTSVILEY